MKIVCLTVGKKHDPNLAVAIEEYEKRLKGSCDFSWQYLSSSGKEQESISILKFLKPDDCVMLLDERGSDWNNHDFASKIEDMQNGSVKKLVILIGGAFGVNSSVFARSNYTVKLSSLVLPHQIVRLVLIEQLYRTYSILNDGKYHHR